MEFYVSATGWSSLIQLQDDNVLCLSYKMMFSVSAARRCSLFQLQEDDVLCFSCKMMFSVSPARLCSLFQLQDDAVVLASAARGQALVHGAAQHAGAVAGEGPVLHRPQRRYQRGLLQAGLRVQVLPPHELMITVV